ncbi:MAG: ChaN family lipoprotein [Deltaproteobacteria bacterium]|nr:ChaN family lipoprotein [Deltaproteobacteria bacterium]
MKRSIVILLSVFISFSALAIAMKPSNQRLYDVNHGKETVMSNVIPALKQNRIIIVGEHHSNISHHEAQVNVIRSLKESGVQVAIGLEMFRSDSQAALDRWVAGDIGEEEFQEIFYDNWGYSWANYRVIFDYARAEKMPLIGLNVPRDITRQVARQGFQSLNKEQKGKLSNIACRVDKEYMDYIKKAFGGHAHGKLDFTYFCEAQLVWDTMMAINALDFLKKNPDAVVIVLTGTGHAQKNAIPRQIRERSDVAHAVILPEVKGVIDSKTVDKTVADYIILDL